MAVETVVKTVGATSRVFATLALWEAGAPDTLTTAERWSAGTFVGTFVQGETVSGTGLTAGKFLDSNGSSYVTFGITTGNSATLVTLTGTTSGATCVVSSKTHTGIIWRGECYNDAEFGGAVGITPVCYINGVTTSSTCYMELTAAAGQSFQDSAGVRSNALKYNQSNGVAVRKTDAYESVIKDGIDYTRISRLQLNADVSATNCPITLYQREGGFSRFATYKDLILQTKNTSTSDSNPGAQIWASTGINILLIYDTSGAGKALRVMQSTTLIGCCVVRPSDRTAGGTGLQGVYGTSILQSSGVFGFTTVSSGAVWDATLSKYNATEQASGLPGSTGNQYSVTFSSATPFTGGASSAMDFRAIAATTLINNGFLDSTNAPNDISVTARTATPTIGVWEVTSAAAAVKRFLSLLGAGA